MGGTNRYLDEHANWLKPFAIFILDHPMLLFVVCCCGILLHIYWTTATATAPHPTPHPNLKLQAVAMPRIGYDHESGVWTRTARFTDLAKTIQISNPAVPGISVKAAHVRAQMTYSKDENTYLITPLSWVESKTSDVSIGVGEIRELIIATKEVFGSWDFAVQGEHGSGTLWAPVGEDFNLEIQLIDVVEGHILPVHPRLYFHWRWRTEPLNPEFYLAEKPKS